MCQDPTSWIHHGTLTFLHDHFISLSKGILGFSSSYLVDKTLFLSLFLSTLCGPVLTFEFMWAKHQYFRDSSNVITIFFFEQLEEIWMKNGPPHFLYYFTFMKLVNDYFTFIKATLDIYFILKSIYED